MSNAAQQLTQLVNSLQADRQKHVKAIEEIDAIFADLGIAASAPKRRGRKPGSAAAAPAAAKKKGGKKRRRVKAKDGMTAEEFLTKVLADGALSTAEINKKWQASGRNGRADIVLGQLVAKGKLKRKKVDGVRGSNYAVA